MHNKRLIFLSIISTAFVSFSRISAASIAGKPSYYHALMSLVISNISSTYANFCPLCETYAQLPIRPDFPIDCDASYSCLNLYLDLSSINDSDPECTNLKTKHQATCCDEEEPIQECTPSPAPHYDGPTGDEPDCPICGTLEFPGIPDKLIIARYVGEYTCGQLYDRGLHGLTPGFICGPLQDFAESACGCGEYNPACIEDETQCWDNVPLPTSKPTPAPSFEQTLTPTIQQDELTPIPFLSKRKPRPNGPKYNNKLSDGRGGAAGRNRGGRMMKGTKKKYLRVQGPQQID